MKKATVLLCCYKDDRQLELALWGYTRQTARDFEVLVVNDGGPRLDGVDTTLQKVEPFKSRLDLQYFYLGPESETFRLAAARNLGLQHARGETLIVSDSDCVPGPSVVQVLADQSSDDRVMIGTRRRVHETVWPHLDFADVERLSNLVYEEDVRIISPERFDPLRYSEMNNDRQPGCWMLCWGCLFAAPTKKVRDLGGFDERFVGWGGEDTDLAERLVRAGGCGLYAAPDAYVFHLDHPQREVSELNRALRLEISRNWTAKRN